MIVGQYLTRNKARPEDTLHDRLYAWASRWWLGPRNTLTSGPGKGHGYRRGNWHAGSLGGTFWEQFCKGKFGQIFALSGGEH